MSNFHGRSANEVSMASGLLVSWLGELLIMKGVITRDEAAAVVQAAEGSASANPNVSTPGAAEIIREIGQRWDATAVGERA
jgi:hypothetical protein